MIISFVSCSNSELLTKSEILEELQAEANRDGKILVVDTLLIISQNPISTFQVVGEELNFFRELKTNLIEMNSLQLELKKSLLQDLNQINDKYPSIEDDIGLDLLKQEISNCDASIAAIKPKLEEVTKVVNELASQSEIAKDDQVGYYETLYFIKGKVNQKILNDTVKVYNRNKLEYFVSLKNVLYIEG